MNKSKTRLLALSLAIASAHSPTQTASQESQRQNGDFGMRIRPKPALNERIEEPRLLAKAPTNESTMIRLPSGETRVFYINRPGSADRMMSVRSLDEGATWSAPFEEFALPGQAYYANQVMQDREGTLHCVFHIFKQGRLGYRGRHLDLWYTRKTLGGEWEKPRMIFEGYVGSLRSFLQTRNGSLLVPMSQSDTSRAEKPAKGTTDYGLFETMVLRSEDGGANWRKSSNNIRIPVDPDQVTRYGAVEPVAIELADGRIWMLIRTNKGRLFETFSVDDGKTWNEAAPSPFTSSDSPAGLLRLRNGNILLLLNGNRRHDDTRSYANGGREALQAALSTDETRTWRGFREVLVSPAAPPPVRGDRGTAYPSAVELPDGRILAVSGQGEESAVFTFHPDWLMKRRHRDRGTMDPANWTFHRSGGMAGVWNFPRSVKGTLLMRMKADGTGRRIPIALSDCFTMAGDTAASRESPFYTVLKDTHARVRTVRLRIRWDARRGTATVKLDGKRLSESDYRYRATEFGLNHLRVGANLQGQGMDGFRILGVKMKSSAP